MSLCYRTRIDVHSIQPGRRVCIQVARVCVYVDSRGYQEIALFLSLRNRDTSIARSPQILVSESVFQ